MKEARLQWRSRTNGIDPARFRFIDESGAKTNMVRLYGRCEQGQRLLSKAPAGHWQTTTMTDLLAWRAVLKTLHPFLAAELGRQFDFARSLELGMLPLVVGTAEPIETLKSYASLYLREEVQAEGLVNFARFLEAMSFSHASLLNTSEVARECQVNRNPGYPHRQATACADWAA